MTRKSITFSDQLATKILEFARDHDRSFSKQVVHMLKTEIERLERYRPILVISEPKEETKLE